jgi:hypothetical protein
VVPIMFADGGDWLPEWLSAYGSRVRDQVMCAGEDGTCAGKERVPVVQVSELV